jgi:hypothetical protein
VVRFYTSGVAHCPYVDAWRVHWVFYSITEDQARVQASHASLSPPSVPQTLIVHRGVLTKLESITGRIKTRTGASIVGQLGRQFLTERIWTKGD